MPVWTEMRLLPAYLEGRPGVREGFHSDRHQGGERVLQRQRIPENADAFTVVESPILVI